MVLELYLDISIYIFFLLKEMQHEQVLKTLNKTTTTKSPSGVSYMNQSRQNILSKIMSFSNSLIFRSLLIVFLSFLPHLVIWLLSFDPLSLLQNSSLLSTCQNHLSRVSTIFSTIDATSIFYTVVISNSILYILTTKHSTQDPHI